MLSQVVAIFFSCQLEIWFIGKGLSLVLVAQTVKKSPAVQETRVQSLGQEDPLEESMAAHSSILARTIPWTEEPGGLQSMGLEELDTTE